MRKIRLILAAALAAAAPFVAGTVDRTSMLDARILAAHNRERLALGVPALGWDARLARDAQV